MPEQHNNNPAPSQFADSGVLGYVSLPDVGIRKNPVCRMADFDFKELWQSERWKDDSKSLKPLMKKLEACLKEDGHKLPDRIDIRLTNELDSDLEDFYIPRLATWRCSNPKREDFPPCRKGEQRLHPLAGRHSAGSIWRTSGGSTGAIKTRPQEMSTASRNS